MKVETILLGGKEYFIIEILKINDVNYYILSNSKDTNDFCVRKEIIENNENYLVGLENELEFNKVMQIYKDEYLDKR